MTSSTRIPAVGLYGELDHFPDLVHCEDLSARAPLHDWHIAAHRHSQMSQLFVIDNGWMKARVDGEEYRLDNNEFAYIPEHCVHQLTFRADTAGRVFSFPLNVMASLGPNPSELLSVLARPRVGKASRKLLQSADILKREAQENGPFRAQRIVSAAHYVLSIIAEIGHDTADKSLPSHSDRMRAFDALITQQLGTGWGPAEYAAALSITTGHLSRLCRTVSGRGASHYIEQKTMKEANRLLAFTQLPIAEVGYRLGFCDPSYFSKRYRAAQGQTPSEYRARFTR